MSQPFRDNLEFFGNQGNFHYVPLFSISCQNVPYFSIFTVLLKGQGGIQGLHIVWLYHTSILFYLRHLSTFSTKLFPRIQTQHNLNEINYSTRVSSDFRSSSHSCNLKRHRRGSSGGTAVTDDDIDDIDVDMEEDDMMEDEEAQVVVIFDHATSASAATAANGTTRLHSSEEDEGRGAEDRLSPESDDLDLDDGAR